MHTRTHTLFDMNTRNYRKESLAQIQAKAYKDVNGEIDPKELLRLELLASLEKYTRAMFKAQYHRSFVVNQHHKMIFKALQDVVDGKITRLKINMPPRYSKTEIAVKSFISWCFALNPLCRFLHL